MMRLQVRPARRCCEHALDGTLDQVEAEWDRRAALGVVMAAAGYPDEPRKGDAIAGLPAPSDGLPRVPRRHRARGRRRRHQRRPRAVRHRARRHACSMAQQRAYEVVDAHPLRRHAVPHATSATARSTRAEHADADGRRRRPRLPARPAGSASSPRSRRRRRAAFARDAWTARRKAAAASSRLIEDGARVRARRRATSRTSRAERCRPRPRASRPSSPARAWEAMGVSLVLHPRNPYVPTVHMNVRMLRRAAARAASRSGGSAAAWTSRRTTASRKTRVHFHRACRDALAPFGADTYPRFKSWCDEYFFLKHRNEPRGIGGIFFDDLDEGGFDTRFALMRSGRRRTSSPPTCRSSSGASDTPYGERERDFQAYRRGRYVEFNLVYDRGTLFGLQSGGRTESILMSLPPRRRLALRLEARAGLAGSAALHATSSAARLGLRQLGGAAEVALRVGRLAEPLGEARELEVRGARFLERQARLRGSCAPCPTARPARTAGRAWRAAPRRGCARASQRSARSMRTRASSARSPRVEPARAARRRGARAAASTPRRARCSRISRASAALAERGGVARRRGGDARLDAGRAPAIVAPAPLEGAGVVGRARAAARRSPAPCIPRRAPARWRRAWRAAPARRSTSSQAPAPRSARSSMRVVAMWRGAALCRPRSASRAAPKSRSSSASSARLTRLRGLHRRRPAPSARSSQRSRRSKSRSWCAARAASSAATPGDGPVLEGDRRLLLGARVAPLVVGLQRGGERGVRALAAAPGAIGAHRGGQRKRVAEQPEQRSRARRTTTSSGDGEEQHRHLDAPGRIDEQHVARVDARPAMTSATAAANTASSQKSDFIPGVRVRGAT